MGTDPKVTMGTNPKVTNKVTKGTDSIEMHGDVLVGAYVLNPSYGNRGIEELCEAFANISASSVWKREVDRAIAVENVVMNVHDRINENGQSDLYFNVELPLIEVLASMEHIGVKVDRERLVEFRDTLAARLDEVVAVIYRLSGREFNLNSPKQLGVVLFDELNLPVIKKTKTGYSTDAEVLEQLADQHEVVSLVLEYRQLAKLKSTYADGLLAVINPQDGRIHSNFNQTVTATGRLSSTEPNLQNIPVRHEMGREFRKVFVPRDEKTVLIDADYSQVELRVLAHMAGDERMTEAFNNDVDIHATTASQVFGVALEDVTPQMRSNAKAVNFGIVYGISEFGLARDLGISRKEAKKYIEGYFENFFGVKAYMNETVARAKETGYIETLFKRRRFLPELKASNYSVRSFGERVAMNAPIQGTAADIIKVAMVKVFRALKGYNARLLLQVHDELLVECDEREAEAVAGIVEECMKGAAALVIPLEAEAKWGRSWYDAK